MISRWYYYNMEKIERGTKAVASGLSSQWSPKLGITAHVYALYFDCYMITYICTLLQVFLTNLCHTHPTQLNASIVDHKIKVNHADLLIISTRSLRFEFPPWSRHRLKASCNQIFSPVQNRFRGIPRTVLTGKVRT